MPRVNVYSVFMKGVWQHYNGVWPVRLVLTCPHTYLPLPVIVSLNHMHGSMPSLNYTVKERL